MKKKRKWARRSIGIAALLLVLAAGIGLILARSRQRFVSKTDPVTGYRCTFTLSRNWQQRKDQDISDPDRTVIQKVLYLPASPTPFQAWIETHLLRRTTPSGSGTANRLAVFLGSTLPNAELHDGYPEQIFSKRDRSAMTILEHHRLLLGGQPATQIKLTFQPQTSKDIVYMLLMKTRDKPLYFAVVGVCDEKHSPAIRAEIEAIRDSFRLEKPGK